MELQTGDGTGTAQPTAVQIADALARLAGGQDSFLILSRGEDEFMQAIGCARDGFDVEYRDGSQETHFQTSGPTLSLETTAQLLRHYLADDARWRTQVSWQRRVTTSHPRLQRFHPGLLMALIGACFVAAVAWAVVIEISAAR
ncbi:MAG: hypothetical protein AVDCRST_MAG71-1962 [uncultured Lysobacter sp.]|uniref:Uncharacterized protein n=1 Tax=uncultured Lysobacter sp. TaxID=271060 RepID=A0A6J4LJW0_9GAMM|nr:MAG: hypothetical protein AVDCRST_MAG71-1962 [uncultured Lysobacter sp.]